MVIFVNTKTNIMSFIHVYVHFVWSTKNRVPFLSKDIRYQVFQHIKENAITKNIHIDFINGYADHVHCLVSMNADLNIGEIAQLLKGESSHWINEKKLTPSRFAWQNDYFAIGVGDDGIQPLRNYMANQESHHEKHTWAEEYDAFIAKYGFDILRKDLG